MAEKKSTNRVTEAALETLRSIDFFAHLRGALRRVGLVGEEKAGVGLFFVMISRFLPNPLRLALWEKNDGGAKYVVRKVCKLLESGTTLNVFSEEGWSRFVADPAHKVAYVRDWADWSPESIRVAINGNQIARMLQRVEEGRIVEEPHIVTAQFTCVSPELPPPGPARQRWLTIKLPAPRSFTPNAIFPLNARNLSEWQEVQRLLRDRAKLSVVLPEWSNVVIEQACQDERASRHVPAFLQAWKTMSLLRSFQTDEDWEGRERKILEANFEDFAVTGLLMRGAFREGYWFPSVNKIFREVFPSGVKRGVISPLTGQGVSYVWQADDPAHWESLL